MKLFFFFNVIAAAALALWVESAAAGDCRKKAGLPVGYAHGFITVGANINGAAVTLAIDTGAPTVLTPETAEKLRLPPGRLKLMTRGATAEAVAGQVIAGDLEFAGDHFHGLGVIKMDLPRPPATPNSGNAPRLAGLLGMDILAAYDLDFDFAHRKLTVYEAKGCVPSPPDFTNLTAIPFKFNQQRNILIPVEVEGRKLTAVLDTGSSLHMITRFGLKKAGVTEVMLQSDPAVRSIGVGNIAAKTPVHTFRSLTIGGASFSNVPAGVLIKSLSDGDMLIGQPYLLPRRFRISSASRTLYVEHGQSADAGAEQPPPASEASEPSAKPPAGLPPYITRSVPAAP